MSFGSRMTESGSSACFTFGAGLRKWGGGGRRGKKREERQREGGCKIQTVRTANTFDWFYMVK